MNHLSKSVVLRVMIAAFAAIILLCSIILSSGCMSMKNKYELPSVVAHRGGADLAPENTLAAFELGLTFDPDMIELDVHLSKDGVLMVFHDPLLARTTGQDGAISDYDAATLATFDAAANYEKGHTFGFQKIPTLAEVVDLVEQKALRPVYYQIEIKVKEDGSRYEEIEYKLVDFLQERNLIEHTIVISFDFPTLAKLGKLEPTLKLGALISKTYMMNIGAGGPRAVAADIASLKTDYVGINYRYLTQVLFDELRKENLGIGAWTVNDEPTMKKLVQMGVDFITTNRPDILRKTLAQL